MKPSPFFQRRPVRVALSDAERQARRRARAYEAGLCGRCFTARRVAGRKSCAACYAKSVERIRTTGLRGEYKPKKARDEKRTTSPSFAAQKRAMRPAIATRADDEDDTETTLPANWREGDYFNASGWHCDRWGQPLIGGRRCSERVVLSDLPVEKPERRLPCSLIDPGFADDW